MIDGYLSAIESFNEQPQEMNTERKIQDYLHFYLGHEAMYGGYGEPDRKVKINGVETDDDDLWVIFTPGLTGGWDKDTCQWFKPILRPLSDMTEEETDILKAMDIRPDETVFKKIEATATMNNWLRKNGFDIDRLIESGLAINKSTLKP